MRSIADGSNMPTHRTTISRSQAQSPFYVGIDLGGTNTKIGLVDDLGRTLGFSSVPTAAVAGPEAAAQRMGRGVLDLIREAGLTPNDVPRVGFGSPGPLDVPTGMLTKPVNLIGWENFPIRDRVSHHCGRPITFANDACAAAYGEHWLGAGRDFHSLIMFTLGTGLGCGIVIGGMLIEGRHSSGAECGHIVIDYHDNARLCGCGQTGHLEAYVCAKAVEKRTVEALEAGRKTSLDARLEHGAQLTPLLLAEEAEAGDALALEIVMDTARYLAVGIVSLMHTIDPDGVLLGGAMTFGGSEKPLGRQFLDCICQEVRRKAFPIPAQHTTIDYATLGSDAGYLGAAGLARAEHRQPKPQ
jgi:glucokinase